MAGSKFKAAVRKSLNNTAMFRPNWKGGCDACDARPIVDGTGLCGPCTWGEADTIGGAWWGPGDEKRYQWLQARCERAK